MFVEANYFCERDKNGEGIGGNSRKKLLPKRDDEQKNQQTNKERQSYSANRLWKAEISNSQVLRMFWIALVLGNLDEYLSQVLMYLEIKINT